MPTPLMKCIRGPKNMKLRTKAGLPEFDDGFPPERATAFQIIKQMIGKQPPD
jgi:hypothetical protein